MFVHCPELFGKIIEIKQKTQKVYHPAVIWQKSSVSLPRKIISIYAYLKL